MYNFKYFFTSWSLHIYLIFALILSKFAAIFYRYLIGSHVFPDVLLNDIAGPEGDPLLLSLKLSVDVLVRIVKLRDNQI